MTGFRLILGIMLGSMLLLAMSALRHHRALDDWQRGQQASTMLHANLLRLAKARTSSTQPATSTDLLPPLHAALANAALPASTCSSLVVRSDAPLGPGMHRRTLTASLTEISPGQLGLILASLRHSAPGWRIDDVSLVKSATPSGSAPALDGNRYLVTLECSAIMQDASP